MGEGASGRSVMDVLATLGHPVRAVAAVPVAVAVLADASERPVRTLGGGDVLAEQVPGRP